METKLFMEKAHELVKFRRGGKTQAEIAKILGLNPRTYAEYLRGGNKPKGMIALLSIFSVLEEKDIIELIKLWKKLS